DADRAGDAVRPQQAAGDVTRDELAKALDYVADRDEWKLDAVEEGVPPGDQSPGEPDPALAVILGVATGGDRVAERLAVRVNAGQRQRCTRVGILLVEDQAGAAERETDHGLVDVDGRQQVS